MLCVRSNFRIIKNGIKIHTILIYNINLYFILLLYYWVENISDPSFREISQISKPKSSNNWNKLRYINIFVLRLRTIWKHFYMLNCVLFPMSYFLMFEHVCGKSYDELFCLGNFWILDIWKFPRQNNSP